MKKHLHTAIAVFVLVAGHLCANDVFGQQQLEEGGEIESVEIEIIKERQITLPRANRTFDKIPPRPAEPIQPEITYDFKSLKFSSPDINPVIRPLRLKQEELSRIYGSYVGAGIGNYGSPFFQASVTSKRDAGKFYGVDLFHRSFGKGPVDGRNSASGNSRVNLFAEGFGPKVSGDAALAYENIMTHFYGYRPTNGEVMRDTILQLFNMFGLSAGFGNTKTSDFNFRAQGTFSYLSDHYNASESDVGLSFNSNYDLGDDKALIFKTSYSLIARKDSLVEPKPRHLLKVSPSYQFLVMDKLRLTAGLNLVLENDRVNGKGFHLYPDVWARYALGKSGESYAALTGDFDKVSLHGLSRENAWLHPNVPIYHTNRAMEFRAGVKGTLARKFLFHGGMSFVRVKNLYFYESALTDRAKFNLVYDDAIRLNFFAETGFVHTDKVQISLRGDYYSYATDTISYPWHRPQYKLSLNSSYKIVDKLLLTFNFITLGGMKARDNELNTVVELQPALDLNVRVQYFISKQFSIYVEGNNILNSSYPLYLYYPVRGAQVSAGLSFSF